MFKKLFKQVFKNIIEKGFKSRIVIMVSCIHVATNNWKQIWEKLFKELFKKLIKTIFKKLFKHVFKNIIEKGFKSRMTIMLSCIHVATNTARSAAAHVELDGVEHEAVDQHLPPDAAGVWWCSWKRWPPTHGRGEGPNTRAARHAFPCVGDVPQRAKAQPKGGSVLKALLITLPTPLKQRVEHVPPGVFASSIFCKTLYAASVCDADWRSTKCPQRTLQNWVDMLLSGVCEYRWILS